MYTVTIRQRKWMDKGNKEWFQGSIRGAYEVYGHKGHKSSWLGLFNQYRGVATLTLVSEEKKQRSQGVCKEVILIFEHDTEAQ